MEKIMDYEFTKEQIEIREKIAAFCKEEIEPRAQLLDRASPEEANSIIKENIKKLAGIGYAGLVHDRRYGGGNFNTAVQAVAGEEVAKACASTALSVNASASLFGQIINEYGTDEQKEKYLPGIIKGDITGCYACSEKGAGSDIPGISTTAEKKGEKWIIKGEKMYVTNAPVADAALVFACSDKNSGAEPGITCYIVDKGTPGFTVGPPLDKMGFRGSPASGVVLDNCELAEGAVLGGAGKGLKIAEKALEYGKLNMAVVSVGIGMKCLELANQYSKTREACGRPINRYQEVAFKLAEMMIHIDISRLLIYKAAWLRDIKDPEAPVLASCAKVFAGEAATIISNMALQVHGGAGYLKDNPVERLYRDAKLGEIIEGTTETQRMSIARDVLNKYAS